MTFQIVRMYIYKCAIYAQVCVFMCVCTDTAAAAVVHANSQTDRIKVHIERSQAKRNLGRKKKIITPIAYG